uniref:Ubiquitin-conjugating enzyme E2S n=1 Tax=Eptatretus burgeri TaxID=7764 RepID=A0A8C4PX16_EPTBU
MSGVSNVENLSPQVLRQVWKEVTELAREPPEGIKVFLNEDDTSDVQATIEGPDGTPYIGGLFRMKLVLGKDFPACPPKAYFLTKIFHPNVSSTGEICVNVLKRDWKAELGIRHVLLETRCCSSCMSEWERMMKGRWFFSSLECPRAGVGIYSIYIPLSVVSLLILMKVLKDI